MKKLYSNYATWFCEACYRRVIIYVPCVILIFFIIEYYIKIGTGSFAPDTFGRVHDGVKVAATMAALGFYAGYMTTDEKKKPKFYENGEKMFHAALLLLIASMLQKFLAGYSKYNFPEFTITPVLLILKGCLIIFVTYATYCLMAGITGFLKILHLDHEELLRLDRKLRG